MPEYKYGIVIDSGSSGSRIQIYRWEDPALLKSSTSAEVLYSPPKIVHEDGWSFKISPGISTLGRKKNQIWASHYKQLIEFAESKIPAENIPETPVYVLSTAGMRLLPESERNMILKETCRLIQKNSKFLLRDCEEHVQTIEGSTEGIYGWLALNYKMGQFDNYKSLEHHDSVGFMDMGGASTQLAFVPSIEEEIRKHDEDLSTVVLRNINGKSQVWRVFVETWLGFGANRARARYLDNLIQLSTSSNPLLRTKTVQDPCMPSGSVMKGYESNKRKYNIVGTGDYQSCLREIYPLLMKNLSCKDQPCLFNGVHAPTLNFEKDKFVGVSEYWYTANDVFHSGGEYNFHTFNEKVKSYCESLWETVMQNSKNGEYSNLSEKFLLDACFKASWVVNILHEGFDLPRLGMEIEADKSTAETKEVEQAHVPFKTADSVNGEELSWTLGKILLVATSQIAPSDERLNVGITPSAISQTAFDADSDSDDDELQAGGFVTFYGFVAFVLLGIFIFRFGKGSFARYFLNLRKPSPVRLPSGVRNALLYIHNRSPAILRPHISRVVNYMELQQQQDVNFDLEEGNSVSSPLSQSGNVAQLTTLRTRSTINLGDMEEEPRPVDFMNRPFINPKLGSIQRTDSRDSLPRISSSGSMARGKN